MIATPDILWTSALAAIPLALAVGILCRTCITRPATRHALWLIALLSLILPALGAAAGAPEWFTSEPRAQAREPEAAPEADSAVQKPGSTARRAAPATEVAPTDLPRAGAASEQPALLIAPPATSVFPPPAAVSRSLAPSAAMRIGQEPDATRATEVAPADLPRGGTALGQPAPLIAPPATSVLPPQTPVAETPAAAAPIEQKLAAALPPLRLFTQTLAAEARAYITQLASARDAILALPALPLPIWLGGSAIALVLMAVRLRSQRARWRRAGGAPAELREHIAEVAAQLGLRRAPDCRITPDSISPMICCAGRPRLLLPESLWRDLDGAARRAVLLHELAHIRRRDHIVCWLQALLGCLYWWHPVVWWARRRIHEEADLCCDAWVVALMPAGGGRRIYAEALLTARSHLSASDRCAAGLPMTTARSRRFSRRLTMVMTAPPRPRVSRAGAVIAATVALTGALLMPAVACPPEEKKVKSHVTVISSTAPKADTAETSESAEEASTFERFMQERQQREGQGGGASQSDEDRLRMLEERLRRIEERLGEIAGRRAPAPAQTPAIPGGVRVQRVPAVPQVPAVPAPGTPAPPGAPTAPPHAVAPGAAHSPFSVTPPDSGEELRIRYYLPSGKLDELSDLMIRQDVPVLVSPKDQYIVVIGTRDTQHRFHSFVTLIHPEGVRAVDDQSEKPFGAGSARPAPHSAGHQQHDQQHEQMRQIHEQMRSELRQQLRQHQAELRDRSAQTRAHLTELSSQARSLEAQRKAAERQAERAHEHVERIQEDIEALHEKLMEAHSALSEADESGRPEAERRAAALEAEAQALEQKALDLARQAEAMERQALDFEAQAEEIEAMAERIEAEFEAHEEQFEAIAEQLQEQLEDIQAAMTGRGR